MVIEAPFRRIRRSAALLALFCLIATLAPLETEARERRRREPSEKEIQRDLSFAAEVAEKGLWREALYRWRKVLRYRPDDPRLLNNIAVALEASGEFEAAREHYERALALANAPDEISGNFSLFASAQALIDPDDDVDGSADAGAVRGSGAGGEPDE